MRLLFKFYRWAFSLNILHRNLYPPPKPNFKIRLYNDKDRKNVMRIYKENAPGIFPDGNLEDFNNYLESSAQSFFIAESTEQKIVACGGVLDSGANIHTICYLLVDPSFHSRGIGSNLVLALIAFATRETEVNFSLIFAINKSMSFWERFSYEKCGHWKGPDQKDYPIGLLAYSSEIITPVVKVLKQRGHLIDGRLPIQKDEREAPFTMVKVNEHEYELKTEMPNKRLKLT